MYAYDLSGFRSVRTLAMQHRFASGVASVHDLAFKMLGLSTRMIDRGAMKDSKINASSIESLATSRPATRQVSVSEMSPIVEEHPRRRLRRSKT